MTTKTKIKFNRCFRLTIESTPTITDVYGPVAMGGYPYWESQGTALQITSGMTSSDGLTARFHIERNTLATVNYMDIKIYNLSENTRNDLVQDRFNMMDGGSGKRFRKIILEAGYNKSPNTIFVGEILEAYSYREGTEIITQIHARDSGYILDNSFTFATLEAGTSKQYMLNYLVSQMAPYVTLGKATEIDGTLAKGTTLNDNTYNLILNNFGTQNSAENGATNILAREIFIDQGKLYVLNRNDYLSTPTTYLISSETGLLGTPVRRETFLECEIIFEPEIFAGQMVQVKSSVNKNFDGFYKVSGIEHDAIISNAVNGDAITKLQLDVGTRLLNGLKEI